MPTEQGEFHGPGSGAGGGGRGGGEVPVGCVIVRDGEIVGQGRNPAGGKQATASHAGDGDHRPGQQVPRHLAAG